MDIENDVAVMAACSLFGELVARTICAEHPELDFAGYKAACSAELFLAAQDMARVGAHEAAGIGVSR